MSDGTVAQASFYELLDKFLVTEVSSQHVSTMCPRVSAVRESATNLKLFGFKNCSKNFSSCLVPRSALGGAWSAC
jgi:hypothetical protein